VVEEKQMALSIQAICGAIIASVVFAIGLGTWLRYRPNDNVAGTTHPAVFRQ
jgi:hypothetical protein